MYNVIFTAPASSIRHARDVPDKIKRQEENLHVFLLPLVSEYPTGYSVSRSL